MDDATNHSGLVGENALPEGVYCPTCSYHLCGVVSNRCPECGYDLTRLRRGETEIPWAKPDRRHHFFAYWHTVWFMLRLPRRLIHPLLATVDHGRARSFWWISLVQVWLTAGVGLLLFWHWWAPAPTVSVFPPKPRFWVDPFWQGHYDPDPSVAEGWPVIIGWVLLCILVTGWAKLVTFWFQRSDGSRSAPNPGVDFGRYLVGLLALGGWLFLGLSGAVRVYALATGRDPSAVSGGAEFRSVFGVHSLGGLAIGAVVLGLIVWSAWRLGRRLWPDGPRRWGRIWWALPLSWLVWAVLVLVGWPLLIAWIWILLGTVVLE